MRLPISVVVASRNRAFYLWACLDALYRYTSCDRNVILVDMCSDDPQVEKVLHAFDRREFFAEIYRAPANDAKLLGAFVFDRLQSFGEYFAYVESDVVVPDLDPCWLAQMAELMDRNPKLAMLGSAIDKRDFVSADLFDRLHDRNDPSAFYPMIKANSPERFQDFESAGGAPLVKQPSYNPAGRLLLLRTDAVREIGLMADAKLAVALTQAGYETGIATGVVHRHLSLTQIFDYPDYDLNLRNVHMSLKHHR
jgi:GT2 family glycosyltransferase